MGKIKLFCLQEIGKLKQKQKDHSKQTQAFATLDNKLKHRKQQGEKLTKETPDVEELLRLGGLIGFDDKSQAETWSTYEAGIKAYESVLKELKKTKK